jgi:hypothetical protein
VGNRPQLKLEATFNAYAADWVFRLSQNHRVDDFVSGNLCRQKRFPFRKLKLYVGESHEPVTRNRFHPLIVHVLAVSERTLHRRSEVAPLVTLPERFGGIFKRLLRSVNHEGQQFLRYSRHDRLFLRPSRASRGASDARKAMGQYDNRR